VGGQRAADRAGLIKPVEFTPALRDIIESDPLAHVVTHLDGSSHVGLAWIGLGRREPDALGNL
jgi:hypothetical protein